MKFKGQGKINICGFEYQKKYCRQPWGGGGEHPKKTPVMAVSAPVSAGEVLLLGETPEDVSSSGRPTIDSDIGRKWKRPLTAMTALGRLHHQAPSG